MNLGLDGRSSLVFGSTRGLGRAVAAALHAEGSRVAVTGRDREAGERATREMPGAVFVVGDASTAEGARQVIEEASAHLGQIDVLVLNGGGPAPATATSLDASSVDSTMSSLLEPHVHAVAQVLPSMRSQGWGRIIAVGSSGVQAPIQNLAASNVGRSALAAYLKTLAAEVAPDGVTVNMVLPGRIATERIAYLDAANADRRQLSVEEIQAQSWSRIPAGRYGDPDEFAACVTFLASDKASYVTGEQLRVDGGMYPGY